MGGEVIGADRIRAAVQQDASPTTILQLAAQLTDETPYPSLTLLRLGDELAHTQLTALAVYHAAAGTMNWTAPLILHAALSARTQPTQKVEVINALSLLGRIATEFEYDLLFLSSWVGWFLVDCSRRPETAEDALDAIQVIIDTGTGASFTTPQAVVELREFLRQNEISPRDLQSGRRSANGLKFIREQLEEASILTEIPADLQFAAHLVDLAETDHNIVSATDKVVRESIRGRISSTEPDRMLQAGQQFLGLLESLTYNQSVTDYAFGTGSLVVELRAVGPGRPLPALDAPPGALQDQPGLRGKLTPLLTAVSNGDFDLSIRTVVSNGRRPTVWAPTKQQAARLLLIPEEDSTNRTIKRVILKGTDPDAANSGYARLQFYGFKETIRASLPNKNVARGWVVFNEYDAELVRRVEAGEEHWDLIDLREPADNATIANLETFKPTEIPRVSDLERLHLFLRIVHGRGTARGLQPIDFGVKADTTIAYWLHFAQAIEAIDGHGGLTQAGSLAVDGGAAMLLRMFANSKLANALRAHAGNIGFDQMTRHDVEAFVSACVPGLSGSTLDQRVEALTNLVHKASKLPPA